jgi:putative flippase GtrA
MIICKYAHFIFIGAVAFFVDSSVYFVSGLLFVILTGQHLDFMQKLSGFSAGVLTTYLYNSRYTFSVRYDWKRFRLYVGSQLFGMAVNLIVFLALRQVVSVIMSLCGATLIAAIVNFFGAKRSLVRK